VLLIVQFLTENKDKLQRMPFLTEYNIRIDGDGRWQARFFASRGRKIVIMC